MSIRPGLSMPLCIRPARVGCLPKRLVAKEFSQHRHRSFRLVIASLQIDHAADRKLQRETKPHGHHIAGVQRTDNVLLRLGRPQGMQTERRE